MSERRSCFLARTAPRAEHGGQKADAAVRTTFIFLVAALALTGCGGPGAKAGKNQDKADAAANGTAYTGTGPNERIGQAVDRANRAAQKARDASADAVKKQGESIRRQADIGATRLDEQAKAMRSEADRRASALEASSH